MKISELYKFYQNERKQNTALYRELIDQIIQKELGLPVISNHAYIPKH